MAGYWSSGSNKLYIDNCYTGTFCTDPLVYGEFDNRKVKISGTLETTGGIKFPDGNTQTTALTGVSSSSITTLGNSAGSSGSESTFFGAFAGHSNSGDHNTFVGGHSGEGNIGGAENSFFGYAAGNLNTSGNRNSFIGIYAGNNNRTGAHNVALGYEAGNTNQNGNRNTSIGAQAGNNNTGSDNIFISFQAGYSETGSNKLYIDNCNAGGSAVCTSPLIYGEFDTRLVQINGKLVFTSDERLKKNIEPLKTSLDKIMHLNGVSYEWKAAETQGKGRDLGLIAQEVESVLPELVHTDSKGYKALAYDKMAPVFVEAIKEQQRVIEEQSELIKNLTERLAKLEQRQ